MENLKLEKEIIKFIENSPIKIEWDYRDELSKNQIIDILENGIDSFQDEMYECNLEYLWENENYFIENNLYDEFEIELQNEFKKIHPHENEEFIKDEIIEYLRENYTHYIYNDLNLDHFLNIDIIGQIKVYSNFDCQTSHDNINDIENYTGNIYQRLKIGVKKYDLQAEFNEMYHAGLLTFQFSISLKDFIELKKEFKNSKYITIPKGTSFGFLDGNYNGSCSVFEHETYRTMTIPINDNRKIYDYECHPDYDCIGIQCDVENIYTYQYDICGCDNYFNDIHFKFSN